MARLLPLIYFAITILPAYGKSPEISGWCSQLQATLKSVSKEKCNFENFKVAPLRTARGNNLVYLDVFPKQRDEHRQATKKILVIGGVHGDELTSVSMLFRWIEWVRKINDAKYQWRFIPVVNPDGLFARPSTRTNANGIDLNRNLQTPDWDKDAQSYWIKRTNSDPRRFPGVHSGSEPETIWLQEQIQDYRPDLIISIHAPYNLLDYDGPVPQPMRFGHFSLKRLGVYPGSMGNYAGLQLHIPIITIELPHGTVMPLMLDQRRLWEDMLKWINKSII